ncbi:uncharacterized protein I303_103794 [Kwoniella dejecticola CBS 10117]|uniref:E3 ubiquitin-protein ligase UBR7 n=1 Tax=Kwoniella dejecticola CBS 10117 TaxID=1296121 RepID=A0A1A6A7R1_9TREE|nr:E3 ubiquitin-protein ligase UBR7 [Kwoniella dejecticola CBS 10117]OBR86094.1 E3 ubiquitin-protein ligase UBR7 [Kwoniella dejecticola CBS 10117]
MESPSASTRFTLLPTSYLASQPPSSEITLQSLIDTSDRMAEEAREALPYSFDECTYDKGYLRQSVWSCLDCGEKGVCYGCSISCHSEHRLVELWTRRSFRCDCPTTTTQPEPTPSKKRRRCQLYPPEAQPQEANEKNHYTHNFKGKFCRCGREYDAETETEAMICCIACEDWFHESCLNLRAQNPTTMSTQLSTAGEMNGTAPHIDPSCATGPGVGVTSTGTEEEDDDEESSVLIRSDTYDGLICSSCVMSNDFLRSQAGKEGWMIIEPTENVGWAVLGQKRELPQGIKKDNSTCDGHDSLNRENADGVQTEEENGKRKAEEEDSTNDENGQVSKRLRLEKVVPIPISANGDNTKDAKSIPEEDFIDGNEKGKITWIWKGKGDIFLGNGIRESLKDRLDGKTIQSLPFPLVDDEIYEPPTEEEGQEETMEQVTSRVMTSLPRVQAIEALHGYQRLKDRLNSMLQEHVSSGRTVSKEDIEGLFEQLKGRK